jgi:hypothetical protein
MLVQYQIWSWPGEVPAIHDFLFNKWPWMAGTRPAMTRSGVVFNKIF